MGTWIGTLTGKRVDLVNPDPATICIEDIANGLAQCNRFVGQVDIPYCTPLSERVLTRDLRWVPAGDLAVGDQLLAFDETPVVPTKDNVRARRHFRPSTVLAAEKVHLPIIRLVMSDGSSVRCSPDHPWLIATKQSRNQTWRTAQQIQDDLSNGSKRYMHRFTSPWDFANSRDAGWLAGIYDGEGYLSAARKGFQMGVAQNEGPVWDKMLEEHIRHGFAFGLTKKNPDANTCMNLQLQGGWREVLRLLGSIRPTRLLNNFDAWIERGDCDKRLDGIGTPLDIVSARSEGRAWCMGLETSTRTYLCEGFGSHNSVAEHSVRMSRVVPPELELEALLHDASEAYLGDVSKPLKGILPDYRAAEARMTIAIRKAFGLPGDKHPPDLKHYDLQMMATEARDFGRTYWDELYPDHPRPLDEIIVPWKWLDAKHKFMVTYYHCIYAETP